MGHIFVGQSSSIFWINTIEIGINIKKEVQDLEEEIEFYKSLDSNKSDSPKSKKSTSSTKKPAKKTTKTKKK